jgi:outer membrane protein assembly factor BamB
MKVLSLIDGSVVADAAVEYSGVNLHHFVVTSDVVSISASSGAALPRTVAYELETGHVAWSTDGIYFAAVGTVGEAEAIFGTSLIPSQDPSDPFPGTGAQLAIDARTGAELWSVPSHGFVRGTSGGSIITVEGQEYEGSYSVVESISRLATRTGALRWSISPGKEDVEPYQRRYPKTFTVSTFVGPRFAYIFGGCAVSALN